MKRLSLQTDTDRTMVEVFNEFIEHCIIKNLSEETIKWYQNRFSIFQQFINDEYILINEISSKTVDGYILYLRGRATCNEVTINSYLKGLRAFLYYAMEMNYLVKFKIRIIKVDKKIKETYTDEELAMLLKKPNLKTATFSEYKIWVFINYLLGTGNRISSVINVKIQDIDFDNGVIQINHTKNRIAQLIPLSQTLSNILKEYLKYRKGFSEDYLFCNTYGEKGDIRTYQDMLKSYNNKRGVYKTSAHLFRHTFAKKWILNGGDIFRLQKILGHSDLSVVREYVNMFGDDLSRDFDQFNPLDRMKMNQQKSKIKIDV
jgi:integrase/recombinase XerD